MDAFSPCLFATESILGPNLARRRGGVRSQPMLPPGLRGAAWRPGAAVTELAICLPVLTLVVFGSIEMCNVIHLKQTLTEAGYEGALAGSQPRATEAEIIQRVQTVLTARKIAGGDVSVDAGGTGFDAIPAGALFTVHVEATVAGNIHVPIRFATFNTVEANVAGHKQD